MIAANCHPRREQDIRPCIVRPARRRKRERRQARRPRSVCRPVCPTINHGSMRLSRFFLPVLRETPKEAEIVSHQLMLRSRHGPPGERRHLFLAAAGLPRAQEDRADRARGAGPLRRHRDADADHPVGRPVAREQALRRLRPGDAALQRPARARDALRADQRGADHADLPRRREVLPRPAAQPLPHPVEVPRRGAARASA